jgi:tetratricopeptide (TPR) repeat protein
VVGKLSAGRRQPRSAVPASSDDIEIRVARSEAADGSCRVSISGPDDRRADGLFNPPFSKAEVNQALAWMDLGTPADSPTRARVREFGERLFRSLFQGAVAGVYVASQAAGSPRRIRLTVDDPAAARIPWELLVDPATGEALALRGRFVRGIATEGGARPLLVDPPLRVLIVDSTPRGLPRLESQLEASDIASALGGIVAQGRAEQVTLEHATLSAVLDALREGAQAQPPRPFHVLHWIGHGYIDPVSGANVLLFEDEDGNVDRVDGARLANVVVGSQVRLVLINACHSAAPTPSETTTPAAETTRAIAEVLLTAGIPAVVGMRVTVLDETARRFAREFYAALADGRGVDDAVLDARILVTGRSADASAEIGVPVAYLRSGSGQLLSTVTPLAWWQVPLVRFRRLRPLAQVALFVLAVIATLAVERTVDAVARYIEGPARMTGDHNIVVTEFDARDSSGLAIASAPALDLAEGLYETLRGEFTELGEQQVQVRPPAETGRLAGSTPNERAVAAGELARKINADIVVYGSLDATRKELQPELFVSDRALADAEELAGPMQLGPPIRARRPIEEGSARADMRNALVSRARALSELIAGLSQLRNANYDAAEDHFDAAAAQWGDGAGKEVVYLFRGSIAGVAGRLDEAERWFEDALALNSSYVRAQLGLAEVTFQRARGTCRRGDPTVDAEELRAAREQYSEAVTATDDPGAVSVSARARLGMARVYICMSQAGIQSLWAEAARETSKVIAAYQAGDESLKGLAAEAYAVRAITRLPVAGTTDPCAQYELAEQDFRAAIELAPYADREAAYNAGLAWVLAQLGRVEEARDAYQLAIHHEPDEEDRAKYQGELDTLNGNSSTPMGSAPSVADKSSSRTPCATGRVP